MPFLASRDLRAERGLSHIVAGSEAYQLMGERLSRCWAVPASRLPRHLRLPFDRERD
jgi:hypothetical protein